MNHKISITIPARNEEKYIGKCLASIKKAAQNYSGSVETIVVLNRCTDQTQNIAKQYGAKLVVNQDKNFAKIRNAGAKQATGDILITIDADSWMAANVLSEIHKNLSSGQYIGGGAKVKFEKVNLSIVVTLIIYSIFLFRTFYIRRLSTSLFWCYKKDFDRLGGFNENLYCAEDIDFAWRLKKHGRKQGKEYGTISYITTSNRKFGDWYYVKNLTTLLKAAFGNNIQAANQAYYDYPR